MSAVLVTLAQGKAHLRIPVAMVADDADIQLKLDQAEATILDYLKYISTTIAGVSVANPTVITTVTEHGLTSGTTYLVTGTTTTPTVNGAQVVTVTGLYTFTVPVNVTIGQTATAGAVAAPVWAAATVPLPVTAAILLMLGRLHEHRGDLEESDADLWLAIERLLMRLRDPALA